ncbi:hypothetical protein NCCP1664_09980 [Zafaria cholistanensis]|uniref:Uncharacterized protein n=1 Tax=Zafaria cholistanensis TaxID=1682741 RepID=A0A5A7NRW9_9MICC|nr:hypothetical protein NCCP1664_09980 [Zafaria cholistanensis]
MVPFNPNPAPGGTSRARLFAPGAPEPRLWGFVKTSRRALSSKGFAGPACRANGAGPL